MTVNKTSFKVAGAVVAALTSTTIAVAGDCPGAKPDAKGYVRQCTPNPAGVKPGAHVVQWGPEGRKVIYGTCAVKTVAGPQTPTSIGLPDGKWYSCPTGWTSGGPK